MDRITRGCAQAADTRSAIYVTPVASTEGVGLALEDADLTAPPWAARVEALRHTLGLESD